MEISPEFREKIEKLRTGTLSGIEEVQAIIDATITLAQLPERSRIDSALARIKVREERAR